jgi:16S rRNA (guanine527-N7)-methyltransferase
MTEGQASAAGDRLNSLLGQAGLPTLGRELAGRFEAYLALILRWNSRMNLTAIRGEEGILSRHFVESIACARALPPGTHTLLDFGSGAGFPGIPIALCRPEIAVTLAESQSKKAAFLHEAIRVLGIRVSVHASRAESLEGCWFDCVTMRAVDRMERAVPVAARLVSPGGSLVLMTTRTESAAQRTAAGAMFTWNPTIELPFGADRLIEVGVRAAGS